MIFVPSKGGAKLTPLVFLAVVTMRFALGLTVALGLARVHAVSVVVALAFTFAVPIFEMNVLNPAFRRARLYLDAENEDDAGKEIGGGQ